MINYDIGGRRCAPFVQRERDALAIIPGSVEDSTQRFDESADDKAHDTGPNDDLSACPVGA